MARKAYSTVPTRGSMVPVWASANTESRKATPIMATSRSCHSHRVALAFRLSG